MKELLLILIVVCVVFAIARRKKSGKKSRKVPTSDKAKAPSLFAAVSIKPGKFPCDAAARILHKRYLTADAPPLPLADCDHARCDCLYVHHDDRREDENDRRLPNSLSERLFGQTQKERRTRQGRRKTD